MRVARGLWSALPVAVTGGQECRRLSLWDIGGWGNSTSEETIWDMPRKRTIPRKKMFADTKMRPSFIITALLAGFVAASPRPKPQTPTSIATTTLTVAEDPQVHGTITSEVVPGGTETASTVSRVITSAIAETTIDGNGSDDHLNRHRIRHSLNNRDRDRVGNLNSDERGRDPNRGRVYHHHHSSRDSDRHSDNDSLG